MPKETSTENGSMVAMKLGSTPSSRLARDYGRRFGHSVPVGMTQTDSWKEKAQQALETGEPVPEWKRHAESPWNGTAEGIDRLPLDEDLD